MQTTGDIRLGRPTGRYSERRYSQDTLLGVTRSVLGVGMGRRSMRPIQTLENTANQSIFKKFSLGDVI